MDLHDPQDPRHPTESPVRRPLWRRWWFRAIAGTILLVVLLVALLPTILGLRPVRSAMLSQINGKAIPGAISAGELSVGWWSGLKVRDLSIASPDGSPVMQVRTADADLSLLTLIRNGFTGRRMTVDGADIAYPQILSAVSWPAPEAGESPSNPPEGRTGASAGSDQPVPGPAAMLGVALPAFDVRITDSRVRVDPSAGANGQSAVLSIKNINLQTATADGNALEGSFDVAAKVGDAPEGTLTGEVAIPKIPQAGVIPAMTLSAAASEFDLSVVGSLLPRDGQITRLGGVADGQVRIATESAGGSGEGSIVIAGVEVGGPALGTDVYRSSQLRLLVPSADVRQTGSGPTLRLGGEAGTPLQVIADQWTLAITADMPLSALQRISADQQPAAKGTVGLQGEFDVAAMARTLPQTMSLAEGVLLTAGTGTISARIDTQADRTSLTSMIDVGRIEATRDGQPVGVSPMHLEATAVRVGDGPIDSTLGEIVVTLKAAGADLAVRGDTLASLVATASADLATLQKELGQIVDFGESSYSGKLTLNVPRLSAAGSDRRLDAQIDLADFAMSSEGSDPIRVTHATWAGTADLGPAGSTEPAIQATRLDGRLSVPEFFYAGSTVRDLVLPTTMAGGILSTAAPEASDIRPATLNNGSLDLIGLEVDLRGDEPLLSMPAGKKIIANASLDPSLVMTVNQLLGQVIFVSPREASGIMELTCVRCERLPLSTLSGIPVADSDGIGEFSYTIANLDVNNRLTELLLDAIGQEDFARSLRGAIDRGSVKITGERIDTDAVIALGESGYPLRIGGGIGLDGMTLKDYVVRISPELLRKIDRNIPKYLPDGIGVSLQGTLESPRVDFAGAIGKAAVDAGQRALLEQIGGEAPGNLKDVLEGKSDPAKALNPLLDLLGGKRPKAPEKAKPVEAPAPAK